MVLTRRRALHLVGTAAVVTLTGCASKSGFGETSATEYRLHIDSLSISPVEHALYEPNDDALFGDPARTALSTILPEGRYATHGYEPLPEDAYVKHEETYYQIQHVVTGQRELTRTLVRLEKVPAEETPDDAVLLDSLERHSARALKILHSNHVTDGESSSSDLLRGDAYVLRRPAERDSQLGSGELDGTIVTMSESGTLAYRVRVSEDQVVETEHTVFAVEVAETRDQFREVVFASRIDAALAPADLSAEAQSILQQATERAEYRETKPLSDGFEELLAALDVDSVETGVNGQLLWYDDGFYRYGLYISADA